MSTDEYMPTMDEIAAAWVEIGRMRCRGTEGALRAVRRALAERDRQVAEQALRDAADRLVREYPIRWAMTGRYPHPGYDSEQAENAANAVILGLRGYADEIAHADSAALERRYPLGVSRSVVDAVEHAAAPARPTTDDRVLIQDREALNAFARTLPPGGWALLILECECPAILARVEDGGRAYAEIRPVDLSPDDDDSHEHDSQGWLSTRALDYPVLVQHNPAALASRPTTPTPTVSEEQVRAIVGRLVDERSSQTSASVRRAVLGMAEGFDDREETGA